MRTLLVVVMTCILGFLVVGCGSDPSEETDHTFIPDDSGGAIPVDSSSLVDSADAVSFEQSEGGKGQASVADSCSGSCNDTMCTCYGTYECCRAGCAACFRHREELQQ